MLKVERHWHWRRPWDVSSASSYCRKRKLPKRRRLPWRWPALHRASTFHSKKKIYVYVYIYSGHTLTHLYIIFSTHVWHTLQDISRNFCKLIFLVHHLIVWHGLRPCFGTVTASRAHAHVGLACARACWSRTRTRTNCTPIFSRAGQRKWRLGWGSPAHALRLACARCCRSGTLQM